MVNNINKIAVLIVLLAISAKASIAQSVDYTNQAQYQQTAAFSPVPQFLIEEEREQRAKREAKKNAQKVDNATVMNVTQVDLAKVDEKVKPEAQEEAPKKVVPQGRPALWYGGPWRKG